MSTRTPSPAASPEPKKTKRPKLDLAIENVENLTEHAEKLQIMEIECAVVLPGSEVSGDGSTIKVGAMLARLGQKLAELKAAGYVPPESSKDFQPGEKVTIREDDRERFPGYQGFDELVVEKVTGEGRGAKLVLTSPKGPLYQVPRSAVIRRK
jgi:hypothetical protein